MFATFEPLKSVEFPMHAEFEIRNWNSKHFGSTCTRIRVHLYTCIVKKPLITMTKRAVKNLDFPQRPVRSEIFAALELLQNCTLFKEEQVASHLRTHLEKCSIYSMLYEKTRIEETTVKDR